MDRYAPVLRTCGAMWRERKVAGAHLTYAARGTQDLTWEVPILGNTLPRVYTPGYLPTHPLRSLGLIALGNSLGDCGVCAYNGRTRR